MMLVVSPPTARQNKLPPQVLQNPRSALADERYHTRLAEFSSVMDAEGAFVAAAK
jgi:hypothetical protein